jgi:hypothetical protein
VEIDVWIEKFRGFVDFVAQRLLHGFAPRWSCELLEVVVGIEVHGF